VGGIHTIAQGCTQLKKLHLFRIQDLTNDAFTSVAKFLTGLVDLHLSTAGKGITDETVRTLSEVFPYPLFCPNPRPLLVSLDLLFFV
jgi:hypothetical protein